LQLALTHGAWGFPEDTGGKTRGWDTISEIKKGDIVVVVHDFQIEPSVTVSHATQESQNKRISAHLASAAEHTQGVEASPKQTKEIGSSYRPKRSTISRSRRRPCPEAELHPPSLQEAS
jgi:hypothetical protein